MWLYCFEYWCFDSWVCYFLLLKWVKEHKSPQPSNIALVELYKFSEALVESLPPPGEVNLPDQGVIYGCGLQPNNNALFYSSCLRKKHVSQTPGPAYI